MFWNILFFVIGFLFLCFLVRCLYVYIIRKRDKENVLVSLPNFFPLLGGTCGLAFLSLAYALTAFSERTFNHIFGIILCSILFFLSLILMLVWHNRTIQYDSQKFISRNFFGKKYVFSYRDIAAYRGDWDVILFCAGKKVVVDKDAKNSDLFLYLVRERYRSLRQGQEIPPVKWKFDPFNGHVENPSQIFAFYVFIFIVILSFWALCLIFCLRTVNEDTAQSFTSVFSSYRIKGSELTLYPPKGSRPFVIRDYDKDILDDKLLFSLCDGQTEFSIYAGPISPSDHFLNNEPFYLVHSLTGSDGHIFLPFEHAVNQRTSRIIFVCLFLGFLSFTGLVLSFARLSLEEIPKNTAGGQCAFSLGMIAFPTNSCFSWREKHRNKNSFHLFYRAQGLFLWYNTYKTFEEIVRRTRQK